MHFTFTPEQELIGETARAFFAENATSQRVRKAMAADGIDRALWAAFCGELGLSGIALPEAHGGAGLGLVELAIVAEAAGAQVAALPQLASLALCAQAIAAGGSAAQQAEWLPGLIAGTVIGADGYCPGLASHGGNRLSGTAPYVAHGAIAGLFVVSNDDESWLVAADAPGVEITALTTMDQTRPLARAVFSDAPAQPLGDHGAAGKALHAAGCLVLAAEALGGAQACLDRTVAFARERVQFGRTIGSFQAYKHRLADMMIAIEQARSAVYWAACAGDEGDGEAELALHAAKSFAADTYFMCAGNMIQLHGGIGFTWEHDAHLFFKRARAVQTMLGSSAWHREQVARLVLAAAA